MITKKDYLIAFEKIARLGSVHAAARELKLTQTAVTQRLKALESDMNLALFLRSRRGMSLTGEGEILLQYFTALKELDAQFQIKLNGGKRNLVELTLLAPTSVISTRISVDCAPVYQKYPFLNVHLKSDDSPTLIDQVKRGDADFAVVSPYLVPNEMDSKLLKSDEYLLVGAASWKRRKLKDILENERIIDFSQDDQMTTNYLKKFDLLKELGRPRVFINENEILLNYFSAGIGFGVLSKQVAKPLLNSGALIVLNQGGLLEDPLALTWYPRANKADYFKDLIKLIK